MNRYWADVSVRWSIIVEAEDDELATWEAFGKLLEAIKGTGIQQIKIEGGNCGPTLVTTDARLIEDSLA